MSDESLFILAANMRAAKDPFKPFELFVKKRGVVGFFYGYAAMRSDLEQRGFAEGFFNHHTYPDDWERIAGSMIDIDASIQALADGQTSFEWRPADYYEVLATLTPAQRNMCEVEDDLGMKYGISIALEANTSRLSGLGLWYETQNSADSFSREWARYGHEIWQAGHLLDEAIRKERPNKLVCLTPREIDCLSWLAHGLRASEICWRLKISEKTFEKHIASLKCKLKSRTRDQALAKAILLGLIA